MMWLPLPLPIPNWFWIPCFSLLFLGALFSGEILWALVSLLLLVYCIWESFFEESPKPQPSDEKKVSNSLPSDDWEEIPEPVRQMEEKKPEPSDEKKASNVEEIKCTNCQQRLNIPRNHTGLAGCPACKMKIQLEDGVITD